MITIESWQDFDKILARSWWDLDMITIESWQDFDKIMVK
jgi:predicted nucleotidyltransferase